MSREKRWLTKQYSPALWMGLLAICMAASWLLPNHYPPWASFHLDAWTATILVVQFALIYGTSQGKVGWTTSTLLLVLLMCVPWLQFAAGKLIFAGEAWIVSAYLLGLLLALHLGYHWEPHRPGQPADWLFAAVGLAAVISVHLQLQTWLQLLDNGILDIWSMGLSSDRPYANLGQPNQLATLLLWGLLGVAWGWQKGMFGAGSAILIAVYLLVGVALTQSRTAWLGLTFALCAVWTWRQHWRAKAICWVATALYGAFWLLLWLLPQVQHFLLQGDKQVYLRSVVDQPRIMAWKIFVAAIMEKPWFGYGWGGVGGAQLDVTDRFPPVHMLFGHSHNLFLDLLLWMGVPLGGLVIVLLVRWYVKSAQGVKNIQDGLLVVLLGVVGIHAMLELPLHYAYFLLPAGLVAGCLNARVAHERVLWRSPRVVLWLLWATAAIVLGLIVRDYFRIEAATQAVRFEIARVGTLKPTDPPEVELLTHMREQIRFVSYQQKSGMSDAELDWLLHVAHRFPSSGRIFKAASALALNGRPEEAKAYLGRICKTAPQDMCDAMRSAWQSDAQRIPEIAKVAWPAP